MSLDSTIYTSNFGDLDVAVDALVEFKCEHNNWRLHNLITGCDPTYSNGDFVLLTVEIIDAMLDAKEITEGEYGRLFFSPFAFYYAWY